MTIQPLQILGFLVAGIISAYLAYRRGKNPILWFFIGAVLGLIGVFAIFFWTKPRKQPAPLPMAPPPEPRLIGPADKFWYFLDGSHAQVGPVSYQRMKSHWKEGTLSPTTFVWHEELPDWKPLQELIEMPSSEPALK